MSFISNLIDNQRLSSFNRQVEKTEVVINASRTGCINYGKELI